METDTGLLFLEDEVNVWGVLAGAHQISWPPSKDGAASVETSIDMGSMSAGCYLRVDGLCIL